MCGIAGCVVSPGRSPDREALERMVASLDPRGPDDRGVVVRDNVGLGATRLAIVDPSPAGHQPMEDTDGRWLLAYNGEIYNHRELRAELGVDGGWRGYSDTETLLRALAAWGPATVERCNGPFAFAAADRSRRRLTLARDRFGKKPLYVARADGALWFASEIRALLAAGLPARPNLEVLPHAASNGFAYGTATPLEGITRLYPGTVATVDLDDLSVSEKRWYEPAGSVDPDRARELEALPRDKLADRLEEALRAAVKRRLMSDVPLGAMCSGGIDSSLITALARDEVPRFRAFTCSFPEEPWTDERSWAERVAEALDIDLETITMTSASWRAALVEAVRLHEYPLSGPGSVPISLIAERARRHGIKVLLTGEGSDELFCGYHHLYRRERRRFLPAHMTLYQRASDLSYGWTGISRSLRNWLVRRQTIDLGQAPGSLRLLDATRERAARAYSHHAGPRGDLEAALLTNLSCSLFPFLLNRMDKDAMGESVETRVPFLDPDVVTLALNMPLEARTGPQIKGVLRDVAARHLPPVVARRAKHVGLYFDARTVVEAAASPGFLEHGVLRDHLGIPASRWRDLIGRSNRRDGFRLWTGEIWARLFLEGHGVERVEQDLWAR